jgi:hypothetical protein
MTAGKSRIDKIAFSTKIILVFDSTLFFLAAQHRFQSLQTVPKLSDYHRTILA